MNFTGTDFLFARPSLVEGVGRVVDFGNTMSVYNYSPSGETADALYDWFVIGQDIVRAARRCRRKLRDQSRVEKVKTQ